MSTSRIVTINEILKKFKEFVESHKQLRDFGYGPTSDIGTSRQMEFPYLWVTHQSDSRINIENKTALPELKFTLLFMDQVINLENVRDAVGEDSDNGRDVISDCFQYLQDMVTEIEKSYGKYGIKILENVRVFPAFDETPDKVNGWAGEITLKLSYVNCDVLV